MKLSAKARYAVTAMTDLATVSEGVPLSLPVLAQRQELPLNYLEQIFSRLRRVGLVISSRGADGGYGLAKPPEEISIYDIVAAIDEPLHMVRCADKPAGCKEGGGRCLTHGLWAQMDKVIAGFLRNTTLDDALKLNLSPECRPRARMESGRVFQNTICGESACLTR